MLPAPGGLEPEMFINDEVLRLRPESDRAERGAEGAWRVEGVM
jgi:hypothetical protein